MKHEITMRITPRERIASLLRGGAVLGLGLTVLFRTLAVAFEWERWANGQEQLIQRWVFFATGIAIGALITAFGVPLLRPAFGRTARLRFEDQWLVIERTGLLARPMVVQQRDLRAALASDVERLRRGR